MEDYRALRQRVIDASLLIQRKGLIRGTSGNISLRSEDGKVIAITPSSIEYEQLTWDMIPLIDAEGAVIHCDANKTVLDNHYKPSSEVLMHTAVMKARQDIEAVVHTHSKFSTLLSFMGQELPIMTIPMIAYFPTPAPIAPFELPGSAALAQAAVKGLGSNGNAVILEKHGLLTVGKTLDKALAEGQGDAAFTMAHAMGGQVSDFGPCSLQSRSTLPTGYTMETLLSVPSNKVAEPQISEEGASLAIVTSRTVTDDDAYRTSRMIFSMQANSSLKQMLIRDWLLSAYQRYELKLSENASGRD